MLALDRQTRQTLFECRRRTLAFLMMYEAGFFELEEEESRLRKRKRSVWVKLFLLRRQDTTCDTMFTIQYEFLAVNAIAKSRLPRFIRRK